MNAIVPCVIVYLLTVSTDAYSPGDRVSALCRTHHDGVSQRVFDEVLIQKISSHHPRRVFLT